MTKRRSNSFLSKQQLWVLAIGGLFLADFVLYGYLPSHERLQSLAEAKDRQMQLITTAEAKSEILPALVQRLRDTDRYATNYQQWIPTDSTLGPFLSQIATVMTDNGLSDQDVVLRPEVASKDLVCIPIHMKCVGDLNGIFGFFRDLQQLGRLVRIERTTLTHAKGSSGVVHMEADAVIFYRAQETQQSPSAGNPSKNGANDET
jgi:Tfp pilus assembly protein PilO